MLVSCEIWLHSHLTVPGISVYPTLGNYEMPRACEDVPFWEGWYGVLFRLKFNGRNSLLGARCLKVRECFGFKKYEALAVQSCPLYSYLVETKVSNLYFSFLFFLSYGLLKDGFMGLSRTGPQLLPVL